MILEDLPAIIITAVIYAIAVLAGVDIAFRRWLGPPDNKDNPQ